MDNAAKQPKGNKVQGESVGAAPQLDQPNLSMSTLTGIGPPLITYTSQHGIALSPVLGLLYFWRAMRRHDGSSFDGYIPNGAVERFSTGLALDVPDGVTVDITSHLNVDSRSVMLHPQHIEGPIVIPDLQVTLHNLGHSSIKFILGDVLARIRAYPTPPAIQWALKDAELHG